MEFCIALNSLRDNCTFTVPAKNNSNKHSASEYLASFLRRGTHLMWLLQKTLLLPHSRATDYKQKIKIETYTLFF